MPFLSYVYDKFNVIVDGEARGLTLAPDHYLIARLSPWKPAPHLEHIQIDRRGNRAADMWISGPNAVAQGFATLGEPFEKVDEICSIGDADLPVHMVVDMVRARARGPSES